MPTSIEYDKKHAEEYLGAAVVGLTQALELSILLVAETKGTENLSWFEEIHQKTILSIKSMVAEHVPIDVEVTAIGFAVKLVESRFEALRLRLNQNDNG